MFIAVVVSALYYSRRVTYPLQRIVKKIEQVGTGDFETKLENYNILEFQQISDSFNEMTVRIENSDQRSIRNTITCERSAASVSASSDKSTFYV